MGPRDPKMDPMLPHIPPCKRSMSYLRFVETPVLPKCTRQVVFVLYTKNFRFKLPEITKWTLSALEPMETSIVAHLKHSKANPRCSKRIKGEIRGEQTETKARAKTSQSADTRTSVYTTSPTYLPTPLTS